MELRNQRAVGAIFLRLEPRGPVLSRGQEQLTWGFEAANDLRWSRQPRILEDYELDRLQLRYRRGLGRGWDVTADAQLVHRGHGGTIDWLLDLYHRAVLNTWDHMRDDQPYGRSVIDLPGHNPYGAATGLGDASVRVANQITPRLVGELGLKLPLGSPSRLLGSGAVDLAASLNWKVPVWARWTLYVQAGWVRQGASREFPEARSSVLQQSLSLVFRMSSREAMTFQWHNEDAPILTGDPFFDGNHTLVSVGYRRTLDASRSWEVYFIEDGDWLHYNVPWFANVGPDLTLGVRYTTRF